MNTQYLKNSILFECFNTYQDFLNSKKEGI